MKPQRPLLVLALVTITPTLAAQSPPTLSTKSFQVGDSGATITVDRGLMKVPLVRSDPESRSIEVEVHRFHATTPSHRSRPPVVMLNGGPGWPGFGNRLQNAGFVRTIIQPYVEIADLVVVGQRGIGSSPPNTVCKSAQTSNDVRRRRPLDEMRTQLQEAGARCRSEWTAQGYDLSGFNVIEAAADVNDARQALGYEQIVIWGVSFGSHWGMTVLRYHPEIVARAVLSGLEGPDHTYDSPDGVLGALERIAAVAEQDARLAPHVPAGGLIAGVRRAIHRADSAPVTMRVRNSNDTVEVVLTGDDLRDVALGYTRRASSRNGIRTWPADMIRLASNDWKNLAHSIAQRRRGTGGMPTASFWMLDCGSGITAERRAKHLASRARDIVGDPGLFYEIGCPPWSANLGDEFRQNFETRIPTLMVHGDWDTSTPFDNAEELAPYFVRGKLVRVEGGSHGALREAMRAIDGFGDLVWRFVRTGDLSGVPERVTMPPLDWVLPK